MNPTTDTSADVEAVEDLGPLALVHGWAIARHRFMSWLLVVYGLVFVGGGVWMLARWGSESFSGLMAVALGLGPVLLWWRFGRRVVDGSIERNARLLTNARRVRRIDVARSGIHICYTFSFDDGSAVKLVGDARHRDQLDRGFAAMCPGVAWGR